MAGSGAQVVSVVYRSTATPGLSSLDLDELLAESRVRNRATAVTGMLLAEEGRFLQALEGPAEQVRALMDRIAADPRHHDVRVLAEEALPSRRFPDWAMAHGRIGEADARPLESYFAELHSARDAMPAPPSRGDRLRSWFRSGDRAR